MDNKLWVWYRTDDSDELKGGHVAAWTPTTPTDEQGTPTGPTTWELGGFADPLMAAQIIDTARQDGALVWVVPDFHGAATLDNLLGIWGDDVLHVAITHEGSNPSVSTEEPAASIEDRALARGTDSPPATQQGASGVQIEPS